MGARREEQEQQDDGHDRAGREERVEAKPRRDSREIQEERAALPDAQHEETERVHGGDHAVHGDVLDVDEREYVVAEREERRRDDGGGSASAHSVRQQVDAGDGGCARKHGGERDAEVVLPGEEHDEGLERDVQHRMFPVDARLIERAEEPVVEDDPGVLPEHVLVADDGVVPGVQVMRVDRDEEGDEPGNDECVVADALERLHRAAPLGQTQVREERQCERSERQCPGQQIPRRLGAGEQPEDEQGRQKRAAPPHQPRTRRHCEGDVGRRMGKRGCAFRLPRVIEITPQREHQDSGYQRTDPRQRRGTVGGISRYEYVLGQNDEQHTGHEECGRPDGGKRRSALRGLGFRGRGGAFGGLPEPRPALDAEGAAIGSPPPTLRAEGIHAGVLRLDVANAAEGYEFGLFGHRFLRGRGLGRVRGGV